jgi:hypothetical protein
MADFDSLGSARFWYSKRYQEFQKHPSLLRFLQSFPMNFAAFRFPKISLCFQRLPRFVGGSTQHGRSMSGARWRSNFPSPTIELAPLQVVAQGPGIRALKQRIKFHVTPDAGR